MGNKEKNATKICKELWLHPFESRIELSKNLKLDKSTVTSEVAKLIKDNIIIELPKEIDDNSLSSGRKPIPLILNKEFGVVLGIAIQVGSCTVSEVSLSGLVIESKEYFLNITKENIKEEVLRIYNEFLFTRTKNDPKCYGLGIGVGGLIDYRNNTIKYSVTLDVEQEFSFIEEIEKETKLVVTLENNANCCAWSKLVPNNDSLSDFIFVLLEFKQALIPHKKYGGIGVGLGFVIDGKIHYGVNSYSGEFRSCFCKEKNENQTLLSKEEEKRVLEDSEIMARFIAEISANIASLANTLDVSCIYIGSDIEKPANILSSKIEKDINNNWLFPVEKKIKVTCSSFGTNTIALGAAQKLINELFSLGLLPE